ncbi:DASH complex subunit HSK3 [Kluyveromyces marxianus]|uniref:DASH complex subunit HSK3 n=2 Tax=Kluyveromyces marxianus TaxID=4911 RepID=W0T726_KLUMD|nr:DASH complex subunit HSK3 [Kluyveromyces marxianus DMKU3-1042]QGN15136.1 DASH complex subunit HSK3 [Kluyveromyces marxianus]BAO39417.1 DASH complex subunit HSK3 [Kluyveromyces marxianus DMKU3-1042]
MDTKQRQYARLAMHLKQLRENLDETCAQVETMAQQSKMITKLGANQAASFIGSSRVFENEMLKK